jgi:thiosulfate dehydrogenase
VRAIRLVAVPAAFMVASSLACSSDPEIERRSAVLHGRDLFASTDTSNSSLNTFACATCHHAVAEPGDARILPGYLLAGAVDRPTFWGGQRNDLLAAINDCRYYFMNATAAWTPDDEAAKATYAFLASLPKTAPAPLPFTVVQVAVDIPAGDRGRGEQVFDLSCRSCHGAAHTGRDRLRQGIPILPEESVQVLTDTYGFDRDDVRLTFIEKVRHGGFLGVFGNMPLYSLEAMSDGELAALLAYLDLY